MMKMMKPLLAVAAAAIVLSAWAQSGPPSGGQGGGQGGQGGQGGMPPRPDFARELGLSADKAAQLEAALKAEREQMEKLRAENRAKLAAILTPEQLARLEQMRPGPPRPGMGQGGQGGPGGPGGSRGGGADCNRPRS